MLDLLYITTPNGTYVKCQRKKTSGSRNALVMTMRTCFILQHQIRQMSRVKVEEQVAPEMRL